MKYAIEILEFEKHKLNCAITAEELSLKIPNLEFQPVELYKERLKEIQRAIKILRKEEMKLPAMNKIVLAKVKCGNKMKDVYVKRIKSKDNSQGWQWSGADLDSYINGDVVSWRYR